MKTYLTLVLVLAGVLISCTPEVEAEYSEKALPEVAHKLQKIKSHPVELEGYKAFFVAERTSKMSQFACSSCHEGELPARQEGQARSELMHLDIEMKHAAGSIMDCRTCHNEKDMDTLRLNNGTPVSFNHAYKMCSQCHFEQGKDWAGGAHGKRLHSWYGKRVVMNCTECHDPHSPAFDQRHPKGRQSIPRTGSAH